MAKLTWSALKDRKFESGLERGVVYTRASTAQRVMYSSTPGESAKAIPWNGLISLEEQGSSGHATYSFEGRPFLHFPRPREFEATLRAFTYPDELNRIMGMGETEADGLYIDSQIGEMFDLSYRTIFSDATGAVNHKIHLVYNVSIDHSPGSYETLSESMSPAEFTWSIRAVPVRVEGYRPAAHFVIDTTNVDKQKLSNLEDILYGTATEDARMPEPQELFDILAWGDAIEIIEMEDGEWMARGSYKNIIMLGDGIFEIRNVNAVDHGDGTFTVSSTP